MQSGSSVDQKRAHPIIAVLSKGPFTLRQSILVVWATTYLIFLVVATSTGNLADIFFSFIHLAQLNFSLIIAVGLYFLDRYYRTLEMRIREIRYVFVIEDDEFEEYLNGVFKRLSSPRGILPGIPFVILTIASIFLFVMPTMPSGLLPFPPFSFLWLYIAIVEFSLVMLPMFGIAIWMGLVIISVSKEIGRTLKISVEPISPDRAGGLVTFSEALLQGVFMYSTLLLLIMPLLVYFVQTVGQANPLTAFMPALGLIVAVGTISVFFLAPQYLIHKVLDEEKKKHLAEISNEVNTVLSDIRRYLATSPMKNDPPSQQLTLVSLQLTQLFEQVQKMKTWPSDLTLMLKATGSLVLILITFFLNQMLLYYLEAILS